MIRVLVVDDHLVVREGLATLVDRCSDMTVVAQAGDGREAVDMFREHRPDVTLMDLNMPHMDGVDAMRAIRQLQPDARVIVLTTYDGDEDVYRAISAGARAYLLKDTQKDEFLDTIRAVHQGLKRISPKIASKLSDHMMQPELTAREIEVLRLIAEGHANREIGLKLSITEGTVKTHVKSILNKLDASDRTQAVTIALRRGLLKL